MKEEKDDEKRRALKAELTKVSSQLKANNRKVIHQFKRAPVAEIESLEVDDCRRMWKELKLFSGWSRKEEEPSTVLDDKKQEVSGDKIYEIWKEAFHALGIEDMKDERFDIEFGESILKQQEEM